jgi:hypothetical protein
MPRMMVVYLVVTLGRLLRSGRDLKPKLKTVSGPLLLQFPHRDSERATTRL